MRETGISGQRSWSNTTHRGNQWQNVMASLQRIPENWMSEKFLENGDQWLILEPEELTSFSRQCGNDHRPAAKHGNMTSSFAACVGSSWQMG